MTAGSKTDTALVDLPQTVTVIDRALIRDLNMQSIAHVTRYVPGISMTNGEGTHDAPIFYGSAKASGDFYIDGVRDDVEYYRDLYNVGRVEALRFCRISQRWRTGRVSCCAESRINPHA